MLGGGEAGLRGGIGWEIMFATVKHHKVTFSHTNTQSHTETQTRSNKHTVTKTIKHTKSQARTHATQTGTNPKNTPKIAHTSKNACINLPFQVL